MNPVQNNSNSFQAYTASNPIPDNNLQSVFPSEIQSNQFIPLIQAMRQNTEMIMAKIQTVESETKTACAQMKTDMQNFIKLTEERVAVIDKSLQEGGDCKSQDSIKKGGKGEGQSSRKELVSGLDVLCDPNKISLVISIWICNRIDKDLNMFWEEGTVANRNSTLSVVLFGVPRREGHRPYGTSLGKDMGVQAREIVSRLMWDARCSVKTRSQYIGLVPHWIFSFVQVCRRSLLDSGSSSTPLPTNTRPSLLTYSSTHPPNSNSIAASTATKRSERAIINDYADLSNKNVAWQKEKILFREAVMTGCESCEKPLQREKKQSKNGKVARGAHADPRSQDSFNRNLGVSKKKIAAGARAIRGRTNKFLSANRVKVRERFYDTVGFILYQITRLGKDTARRQGFYVQVPVLSDEEQNILSTSERFHDKVRAAETGEVICDDHEEDTNMRVLDTLTSVFPSLSISCFYSVEIDKTEVADATRNNEAERVIREPVPDRWNRCDRVDLLQLSLIILTEYTRALSSNVFLRSNMKSIQAVVVTAFAMRALICRTNGDEPTSFHRNVLGNVFFTDADIPSRLFDSSTIMAFTDDKSNKNRLDNKLRISIKEYYAEKNIENESTEEQNHHSDNVQMESNDLFNLLSDEDDFSSS